MTTDQHDSVPKELLAFAAAIRDGEPHRNSPEEALLDVAVVEAMLRSARKHAMDLVSRYSTEIPYWYRLMLDSRQESPIEASGMLTNLTKMRDPEQRKSRIDAVRKELRLR